MIIQIVLLGITFFASVFFFFCSFFVEAWSFAIISVGFGIFGFWVTADNLRDILKNESTNQEEMD